MFVCFSASVAARPVARQNAWYWAMVTGCRPIHNPRVRVTSRSGPSSGTSVDPMRNAPAGVHTSSSGTPAQSMVRRSPDAGPAAAGGSAGANTPRIPRTIRSIPTWKSGSRSIRAALR